MKCIIKRTSIWGDVQPCDEAEATEATFMDWRTFSHLEDVKKNPLIGEGWLKEGKNHHEENGMVVRELERKKVWVVSISTLKDLLSFSQKHGHSIIVSQSNYKEFPIELEIYDDYRE